MAGKTRKSVLAIKKEITEGTLVLPAAGTDFTALQEGFSMAPSFEELVSAELVGSIGQSRSVLGFENPEASFSHYLKGSGVEGQKPDYHYLIEAAFGQVATQATERVAQAASTVSVVKVAAGQGAEYERGKAVLVKKSSGYEVRNVLSVTGDDLNIAQNLASSAGLVGASLGKPILFKPADDDHPTLSITLYRGNGHNVEAESGIRVTEMSATFEAGEQINAEFSMAGLKYFFNPIEITASTGTLDWTDDSGTYSFVATAKAFRDPHELAKHLEDGMNTTSTEDFTVVYNDSNGKFVFATATSAVLTILWNTGAGTAQSIAPKVGFTTVADSSASLTYTSANALSLNAPYTPDYDESQPLVAKANEVMLGDADDITCFGAQSVSFSLSNSKSDIPDICEDTGRSGSIISAREVTIDIKSELIKFDVDKFKRFREAGSIMFTYNAGEKSGGNWVPGKIVNLFIPTATISSYEITDTDGMITLEMSLRAYVSDGLGEVYINIL